MRGRGEAVKVWVFAHCFNERAIAPFFLRHYAAFADQIHVWDDQSDDGTRELLQAHPKVVLHDWPGDDGMDEEMNLALAGQASAMALGQADWCMWPDMDEILYHPHMPEYLARWQPERDVLYSWGFNMMAEHGLPTDDGHSQIWELLRTGVHAPIYSKPVIWQPAANPQWCRGKHHLLGPPSLRIGFVPGFHKAEDHEIKLLHYRYLGVEYTRARNRRNYARLGIRTGDKGPAWGVSESWKGEGSPEWVAKALPGRYDVVDENADYTPSPIIPNTA